MRTDHGARAALGRHWHCRATSSAMSVQPAREQLECGACDGPVEPHATVRDAYCSTECYLRDRGEDVLENIREDHTVCPSCFSTIKEVERPDESTLVEAEVPASIREIFVGFQHRTPRTDFVEIEGKGPERPDVDWPDPRTTVKRAWGCECGTAEGHEADETIERVEGADVVLNLLVELRRRYRRGELDHKPSSDRLMNTLRDHGRDWDLAVGAALYGGNS